LGLQRSNLIPCPFQSVFNASHFDTSRFQALVPGDLPSRIAARSVSRFAFSHDSIALGHKRGEARRDFYIKACLHFLLARLRCGIFTFGRRELFLHLFDVVVQLTSPLADCAKLGLHVDRVLAFLCERLAA
jgi:hypothetical protein